MGPRAARPRNYPTIQAAFEACAAHDTVLVALGVYAEELTAPALPFVLRGDVEPDSIDFPYPVIDPSTLTDPRQRHCLRLPAGSQPVIEDMVFYNGPAMYPRVPDYPGGILCNADTLTMRRCLFRATNGGIVAHAPLAARLESCRFRNCRGLFCFAGALLEATDCVFTGRSGTMVSVSRDSRFERCHFADNSLGELLVAVGPNVLVHQCEFGPDSSMFASIYTGGGIFEDCLFHDRSSLSRAYMDYEPTDSLSRLVVRNCAFVNNRAVQQILTRDNRWPRSTVPAAEITDNVFINNVSVMSFGKAIESNTGMTITGNRFAQLTPPTTPAILFLSATTGPVTLRHNLFEAGDLALRNLGTDTVDAAQNWWGDSTGPYHETLNPAGQGATVDGPAVLSPWHADTTFLSVERPVRAARPQAFTLTAYPNPFNSTVRLRLECADPAIVRVELFDVLGRRVREVWAGLVAGEREVVLDAQALPSGTYIARATDTIDNRPLATTKLLLVR